MKKQVFFLCVLMTFISAGVLAQESKGKVTVEITKEENGEKKTFKGTYDSKEEMNADPNYRDFTGEDPDFNFWFDGEDDQISIHIDRLKNMDHSVFRFFDEEDGDDSNSFFFQNMNGDSSQGFFNLNLDNMDLEEYREQMKEMGIEMEGLIDRLSSSVEERSSVSVLIWKKVKVMDVGEEFGKKGKVSKDSMLELDDLSFYPNPSSNGRFRVRFTAPMEDELSIKVSNLDGKEVFSRYFERFSGSFSESIDLSGQKEGIYLMEIVQGKKRLTKKIVIN